MQENFTKHLFTTLYKTLLCFKIFKTVLYLFCNFFTVLTRIVGIIFTKTLRNLAKLQIILQSESFLNQIDLIFLGKTENYD